MIKVLIIAHVLVMRLFRHVDFSVFQLPTSQPLLRAAGIAAMHKIGYRNVCDL
jgi:hypothetical protein